MEDRGEGRGGEEAAGKERKRRASGGDPGGMVVPYLTPADWRQVVRGLGGGRIMPVLSKI